jgi:TonB-dependent receptor
MNKFYSTILLTLITVASFAQGGKIRGRIIEKTTAEAAIGATVKVLETNKAMFTDLDGTFSFDVAPGTYIIEIGYIGFKTTKISEITIKANETKVLDDILLEEDNKMLEEIVVRASLLRTTEEALNMIRKKSNVMLDGISAAKIRQIGDNTAVEAAKRITGVSIEGGKYVYIRGLGDRYSKTTLNNVDIPGLDPDMNTVQMDIFPTNLIDNIVVSKNFTAEQSADFTGGLLNVETKDFPERKLFAVSVSGGFNPSMHFNPNALSYKGGKTDWLGYDDGTRALPALANNAAIPTPISGSSDGEVNSFVRSFNPTLAAKRQRNTMNHGLNISAGDQLDIFKNSGRNLKLGYIFSLSYKSDQRYYDDVTYGEYQRFIDPTVNELRYATIQQGEFSENNVLIGSLGGIAIKSAKSKIRLTAMRLQNGESRAGKFNIKNSDAAVGQSGYFATSDNLEYNQRSLTNILLNGVHRFGDNKWQIDWKLSPTFSTSYDPDIRKTAFTVTDTKTSFNAGAGGNPSRIWRYLNEVNYTAKFDVDRNYTFKGNDARLKFGFSHLYKQRDYEIKFFDVQFFGRQSWDSADPSQVLSPQNIYPSGTNNIYYQSGNNNPNPNQYNSDINNTGVYASNEMSLNNKLKTVLGVRVERYVQRHTGRDQKFASGDVENGKNLVNEEVINSINLFPSVNFIYQLDEKTNVRLSYTKTIARPSFKELSFAQIIDPITNRIFNGSLFQYPAWNGNLKETNIDNIDLRLEKYLEGGQLISASVFYKHFLNPIELVRIPEQQTSSEFQPRNVGNGRILGLEFEFNHTLGFVSERLSNFAVNGNFTYLQSEITMSNVEFLARKNFEKTDQVVSNKRQMAGQSPFVINAGLTYNNVDKAVNVGLFYNVKGSTLTVVGIGLSPDVYSVPFNSLNFSFNKKIGTDDRFSVDVKATNLLNDKMEVNYKSFETKDATFSSISPGRTLSLGLSYRL